MRFIYGLVSFFLSILLMAFLYRAGLKDLPNWAVYLSLMIAFAGGCAGGD